MDFTILDALKPVATNANAVVLPTLGRRSYQQLLARHLRRDQAKLMLLRTASDGAESSLDDG